MNRRAKKQSKLDKQRADAQRQRHRDIERAGPRVFRFTDYEKNMGTGMPDPAAFDGLRGTKFGFLADLAAEALTPRRDRGLIVHSSDEAVIRKAMDSQQDKMQITVDDNLTTPGKIMAYDTNGLPRELMK